MSDIKEVSRLAGVSTATVSRALSHPEKLAKKTLDKVHEAIKKANYQPNMLSRNFRRARSFTIVVLVPNIANPFYSRVIRGIEEVAQKRGYSVLLGDTRNSISRESEYFQLVSTRQADGAIQLSSNVPEIKIRDKTPKPAPIPIVNACEYINGKPFPTVGIDNQAAASTLCDYLIKMGHKRIGVVKGPDDNPLTKDRLSGYRASLKKAKITYDKSIVVSGDFTMASGFIATSYFTHASSQPTAIFCMNDEMAIGLIQGLKSKGLRVPQDISVAGFDDIEFAKYADPPLTTISQPAEDIGRTAMNVLYGLLEGTQPDPREHILNTEFILRKSTASPSRQ